MGVPFFEHLGGKKYYVCNVCGVYLTKHEELINTRFYSSSGPAALFDKVVNVVHGDRHTRNMVTGPHIVRDVFCKKCGVRLGWFYEFATRRRQEYKEGKTILEDALIRQERSDFD